jgi:cell division septation protein DedD
LRVRCGPQSAPHVTYKHGAPGAAAGPRRSAGQVRVAPKHVYERQKASTRGVAVPDGYAPVWEDGRLNPRRAHQTFDGKARMELVWTKTVPRELIIRETGQVVTDRYPGLRYPHTSHAGQKRAQPDVATRGTARAAGSDAAQAAKTDEARVSTRSEAADSARAEQPASHRYVKLGAFPDPDHALRAAKRVANSGLPARMGDITRNGKDYKIVLAGPFETQAQLDRGLRQVRGMGYSRAVLRK